MSGVWFAGRGGTHGWRLCLTSCRGLGSDLWGGREDASACPIVSLLPEDQAALEARGTRRRCLIQHCLLPDSSAVSGNASYGISLAGSTVVSPHSLCGMNDFSLNISVCSQISEWGLVFHCLRFWGAGGLSK